MAQPKSVSISCLFYRAVLCLGPSTFRMEFQHLLLSDFRHLCLKTHAQAGAAGVFALLPYHILHTFCDISGEHFDLIKSWTIKTLQTTYQLLVEYTLWKPGLTISEEGNFYIIRKKKKKRRSYYAAYKEATTIDQALIMETIKEWYKDEKICSAYRKEKIDLYE